MADDSQRIAALEQDLADLRKLFLTHLGPRPAATSLNIPHPDLATREELTRLIGQGGRYL